MVAEQRPHPHLMLVGGTVITMNPAAPLAQAVSCRGDRILSVGTHEQVLRDRGTDTIVIDVGGRTIIPGLVDAHAHLDREGLKSSLPSLAGCATVDDVLARVQDLVRVSAPGEWVVTSPLGEPPEYADVPERLRQGRVPTRWDLDRVSPANPVFIRPPWGYWTENAPLVSVANSAALEAAGISRDVNSGSADIVLDRAAATGEMTGIFLEFGMVPLVEAVLMRAVPAFTHQQRREALLRSVRTYHRFGTTSVFEGHGLASEVLDVYRAALAAGQLTIRTAGFHSPSWGHRSPPDILKDAGSLDRRGRQPPDAWLHVEGLFVGRGRSPDYSLMVEAMPHTGWAGFSLDDAVPEEMFRDVLLAAARAGVRLGMLGWDVVDLLYTVHRQSPIAHLRWVIEHIKSLSRREIGLIKEMGLVVTTHTNRSIYKHDGSAATGPEAEDIVPLRSLFDAGVPVALGTDNLPPSLFHPLWQCVARLNRRGGVVARTQSLTRWEALRAATLGGAYLSFDEGKKGSLESGKLADLVVLGANPLTVPLAQLRDLASDITVVGGEIVHQTG